jgi:hypothetical protein
MEYWHVIRHPETGKRFGFKIRREGASTTCERVTVSAS